MGKNPWIIQTRLSFEAKLTFEIISFAKLLNLNHYIGEAVGSMMDLFVIKSVKTKMNGMTITVMEAISTFWFRCSNIISLICNSSLWAVIYFVKMLFLFQILLIKTLFHQYLFGIFCHWGRYLVLGIIVSAPLFSQSPTDILENNSCSFYKDSLCALTGMLPSKTKQQVFSFIFN